MQMFGFDSTCRKTTIPEITLPSQLAFLKARDETKWFIYSTMTDHRNELREVVDRTEPHIVESEGGWDGGSHKLPPIGESHTIQDIERMKQFIDSFPKMIPALVAFSDTCPEIVKNNCVFCPCDNTQDKFRYKHCPIPRYMGSWKVMYDSFGKSGLKLNCSYTPYEKSTEGLCHHIVEHLWTPESRGKKYNSITIVQDGDQTDYYHLALQYFLCYLFPDAIRMTEDAWKKVADAHHKSIVAQMAWRKKSKRKRQEKERQDAGRLKQKTLDTMQSC